MIEQEMLTFAAKAAGITIATWSLDTAWIEIPSVMHADQKQIVVWDPRQNPADALQLAALCNMIVDCSEPDHIEVLVWPGKQSKILRAFAEGNGIEAVCEAIFKLAVKIGRAMP